MAKLRSLPEYRGDLAGFAGVLRKRVFSSQSKAGDYFSLNRSTIARYESENLPPPVGYLACLAQLLVDTLKLENKDDITNLQHALLQSINRAIQDEYPDEVFFQDWRELCVVANNYFTKRQATKNKQSSSDQASSSVVTPQTPWQLPPLPDSYISRKDFEKTIRSRLSPKSSQNIVILSGPGGAGKSTLAIWAANELARHFPDGILWLDCQPDSTVFDLQTYIAWSFEVVLDENTLAKRAKMLRSLLREKHCLIVLDNLWGEADLEHLKIMNATCRMLITTRDKAIAYFFTTIPPLEIGGLTQPEGRALLSKLAGTHITSKQRDDLLLNLAGLPLALSLAGALVGMGVPASHLLEILGDEYDTHKDLTTILEIGDTPGQFTSLKHCFDLSYKQLSSANIRQSFLQLSCFIGTSTAEAAAILWQTDLDQTYQILHQLVRFNLVEHRDPGYRLHALIGAYARNLLSSTSPQLEQTARRRHAAYYIRHFLYHPAILENVTHTAPDLDEHWANIVAGVRWASTQALPLAAIATVLAHSERLALLEAVGESLITAVVGYASQVADEEEQAILYELLGDLYLATGNNDEAMLAFSKASHIWLVTENHPAASRAVLRVAGMQLIRQDQAQAAETARQAQSILKPGLPLSETELSMTNWLFYWFNVIYGVLVKWSDLPEDDVIQFAELAQKAGHAVLEARGWHIYRLWCTAREANRLPIVREKGRQLAARAAWMWWRNGQRDKALAEVMWTQEATRQRRSRRMIEAFARRRSQMTPELSQAQIKLIKSPHLRQWLTFNEEERVVWLVKNLPPPGSDDWQPLDDILGIGVLGKNVRRLAKGLSRPDEHILSEPMWRVLTAQRTLPLAGEAAKRIVKRYLEILDTELREETSHLPSKQ